MITVREYNDSGGNPLYPAMYYTIPGTDDFELVTHFNDSGGYDWTDWVAWYSPTRRMYFVASGSGCSCNSLTDDYYTLGDFVSFHSKETLKADLVSFINDRYEYTDLRNRPRLDDNLAAINSFKSNAVSS
ncbi:hypothetical protein SAMN05428970_1981 [Agromyces sp. CF514]|uniref:DUF7574 domain-containing protein n=1 Tax=Agromyces sp. CF514 TaxID=1881031 RepID=UPI0008F2F8DC|nr:hypothetical protein [Agromyces sp. CF514]SFR75863.1 hypothetical protein SAMN05428970_1981 [Agromyces sp. CF514]